MPICPNCGSYVDEGSPVCSCGASMGSSRRDTESEKAIASEIKRNMERRLKSEAKHLREMGNYQGAIEKYKEVYDVTGSSRVYLDIADVYLEIGNYSEALYYAESSKHDSSRRNRLMAEALSGLGRFDEAVGIFKTEIADIKNDRRYRPTFREDRSYDRDYVAGFNSRREELERERDLKISEAFGEMGWICHLKGDYDEAIRCYENGIKFCHDNSENWNLKAISLEKKGCYVEAIKFVDVAIRLNPKSEVLPKNRRGFLEAYALEYTSGRYTKKSEYLDEALRMIEDDDVPIIWGYEGDF